jgi:hypothetical protein
MSLTKKIGLGIGWVKIFTWIVFILDFECTNAHKSFCCPKYKIEII